MKVRNIYMTTRLLAMASASTIGGYQMKLFVDRFCMRPGTNFVRCQASARTISEATTTRNPVDDTAKLNSIEFRPSRLEGNVPVIVLHGLLGNAKNFQSWGASLASNIERPRRIYALDMRNHGSSSHHSTMTYSDMARDISGFMDEKDIGSAVLIGHSMGGKAACMTALLNPERIKGLVILDISPVSYSVVDQTNWGETQRIIDSIHKLNLNKVNSKRDADSLLEKDIVDPMIRAFALTNLEKVNDQWTWRINVNSIYKSMSQLAQFEVNPGVDPISKSLIYNGDTLFIAGGKSRYIRSSHLPQIAKMFPNHTLQKLPNASHWVHSDDPKGSVNAVKNYLDRVELP